MDPVPPASPMSISPVVPLPEQKSKIWVWIVSGIILLGVGIVTGVFLGKQLYSTPQPVPTPLPPETSVQEGDPTATWKTYTYQDLVFRYPADWVLDTEKKAIRPPYLKNGEEYPAITFYTIDNPDNLSIKEYDDKAGNAMMRPGLYSSSIGTREVTAETKTANGINGYYLKDQNCEPLGCDRFSFVINKKIYVITNVFDHQDISSQNSEKENLRKIFDQILSTFKFVDQGLNANYTCPTNGWVNCMPILNEAGKKACSPEALGWYKANCPNFKGVAY